MVSNHTNRREMLFPAAGGGDAFPTYPEPPKAARAKLAKSRPLTGTALKSFCLCLNYFSSAKYLMVLTIWLV